MNKVALSPLCIFLLLFCILPPCKTCANGTEQSVIMFRQLSTTEGISNNDINSLWRDSRGFLWIGTASGLNRYDSYTFQQYYQDGFDLPDNRILDMFEDWEGNMWFGTDKGYTRYDYKTGRFNSDIEQKLKEYNISCDTIAGTGIDNNRKYLWVHDKSKIYLYDHSQKVTKIFPLAEESIVMLSVADDNIYSTYNSGKLYVTNINSSLTQEIEIPVQYNKMLSGHFPKVFIDNDGGIWVHTFLNSLLLYKKNMQEEWTEITLFASTEKFNRIRSIAEDHNGNIWLITSHLGAFVYQPKSGHCINLSHDPLKPHTIASNNLNSIYVDCDGIVWIGNFKHGVSYYVPQAQAFLSNKSWTYNDILAFCEDSSALWYGTDGGGLVRQSLKSNEKEQIPTPANVIVTMKKDSRQRLWLGCYQNGLICYDQGKVTHYTSENSELRDNDIYGIEEDKYGNIWVSTLYGSIQKLSPEDKKFETVMDIQNDFNMRQLLYNGDDTLYAATSRGLMAINTKNNECRLVETNKSRTQQFGLLNSFTIYKDSRNIIWIGHTQGLTLWNLKNDSIYTLNHTNGLPANMVKAIIEDNNKQMWIGTCNGMSRINLAQKPFSITNFDVSDGISSNDVNERALYKMQNGNILVGTPNGYTTIIPQEIVRNDYNADIYLTNIEPQYHAYSDVFNGKSPECAEEVILKEGIQYFQLHFSTLDFIEQGKVRYAYRIKGEQTAWNEMTNNRIDFSMLPAGTYSLQVKACNSEYMWSPNVKTITIRILPFWYKTWWAYMLYIAIVLLIAWRTYRYFYFRRKQIAALKNIEQENERQQKITDMKMQFFANVSHELRTPLSLILNPLEEFLSQNPQHRNTLLYTAHSNAKYLLELINQLLDFRKLDANGEVMHYIHGDIVSLVKDQFQSFDSVARNKGIRYQVSSECPDIYMDFDYDKVRKIVMNILSNAFKFTEPQGSIVIKIDTADNNVVMQFCDTGCGIDDARKEKIFQCFYQAYDKGMNSGGSGIGLYLVSEYVRMHKGSIRVSDNEPQGSIFTVTLPLHATAAPTPQEPKQETSPQLPPAGNEEQSYTILLVDDNYEFIDFLSACLSTNYKVLKAMNGLEALEVLKNENIDIIVSDVMMPKMDGLELCASVKNNICFSHIPIILLTAKASEEYQLEGLNTGADDYITKPFNMEILKLRIGKFIETSMKKHELFNQEIKIEPSRITITPLDQQFVAKAIQIVESNINNVDFSVEELAAQLNISRGYLYKKMVKITGKTSLEFIRVIRMKRAQQLLAESQMQVAEIAYMLGYNSPKVFTRHFKEAFNISPSEFIRSQKDNH